MLQTIDITLAPKEAASELIRMAKASDALGVDINRIKKIDVVKRSIDARQRNVKINFTLRVHVDNVEEDEAINPWLKCKYNRVPENAPTVIVVGAGPAGLFAALQLIEDGIRPLIFERGKDVDSRRKDLALIAREQKVNPESNYCFGEGGAGTFSDGKLFTRSKKKGPVDKILAILHLHGASASILYEAHAHIGTDKLPDVIRNIRNTIIDCGGEIYFNTRVDDLIIEKNEVTGVVTQNDEKYCGPVILATGHSARDTFRMLHRRGVRLEAKGLAMGVRLEHPQHLIDTLQYHSAEGRGKYLPAAEYAMVTQVDGRGVYSFCMCPGGVIVPSASGPEQSAVNGMSASARGSRWANAAMVVQINPDDVAGSDALKMLRYQESIERRFFDAAEGSQQAPAQRMTDFVEGRQSVTLEPSSYAPGVFPYRVDKLLPEFIADRLKKGFVEFNRKKRGFLTSKATVVGAETRTSSPIRIPRDKDTMCHTELKGLYPVGEGAGWAGGIVSSAIDGQNAAKALAAQRKKMKS